MRKKPKTKIPVQTTPEESNQNKATKEAKAAVAEALVKAREGSFGKRAGKIFLRLVFLISLFFFSIVFGAMALVFMPIVLPAAYAISSIKGEKIKL